MTIMTVSDMHARELIDWNTDESLLDALGDLIPDDERIHKAIYLLEKDILAGREDNAAHLAKALGLRVQERVLALTWQTSKGMLCVTLEEWSPIDHGWIAPLDDRLADLIRYLRPGVDWQSPAPYQEAEDHLLAAAGLTRDDISETITCW